MPVDLLKLNIWNKTTLLNQVAGNPAVWLLASSGFTNQSGNIAPMETMFALVVIITMIDLWRAERSIDHVQYRYTMQWVISQNSINNSSWLNQNWHGDFVQNGVHDGKQSVSFHDMSKHILFGAMVDSGAQYLAIQIVELHVIRSCCPDKGASLNCILKNHIPMSCGNTDLWITGVSLERFWDKLVFLRY